MTEYPEYAVRNRKFWSDMSDNWVAPGRRCWESPTINWGIWNIPESEVRALGDLSQLAGKDTIELGCGTGYFSGWLAKHGARPVGIDITPAQLETARGFQKEFGYEFPLVEGNAEEVPYPDASFDLAVSEYGASIWCDPYKWIPEAARLLRPGGTLVFLRNSTISTLCMPNSGPIETNLKRPLFGLYRLKWDDDDSVEFHIPTGEMLRLLIDTGFTVKALIDLQAPAEAPQSSYDYMDVEWARQWPSEEIWVARKSVIERI